MAILLRLPCGACVAAMLAALLCVHSVAAEPSPELRRSLEVLTAKAAAGEAEAQFWLGLYFQHSKPMLDGAPVDYPKVVDLYERAAAQGHVGASFALAMLYDEGLGVQKDVMRAIELYTVAAEAGHAEAMGKLGAAYVEIGDFTWAAIWSRKAAELGDPGGLNNLGALHHAGLGVEKDYGRAMELYRRAAEGGDCLALMNIGGLYYNGDGVVQDGRTAEAWFQKARECDTGSTFIAEYTARYMDNIRRGELPPPERLANVGGAEILLGTAVVAVLAAAVTSDASASPAGREPPPGPWQAKFWCYTDFTDPDPVDKPTWCIDQAGGARMRTSIFDPCNGVDGWCDGFGLGPRPGFMN